MSPWVLSPASNITRADRPYGYRRPLQPPTRLPGKFQLAKRLAVVVVAGAPGEAFQPGQGPAGLDRVRAPPERLLQGVPQPREPGGQQLRRSESPDSRLGER